MRILSDNTKKQRLPTIEHTQEKARKSESTDIGNEKRNRGARKDERLSPHEEAVVVKADPKYSSSACERNQWRPAPSQAPGRRKYAREKGYRVVGSGQRRDKGATGVAMAPDSRIRYAIATGERASPSHTRHARSLCPPLSLSAMTMAEKPWMNAVLFIIRLFIHLLDCQWRT